MPEERKLVSILFADVTGSTALGEMLDPEDVRALMGRYYEHARRVVADHGGTVEKFIGDAVMAVFGLTQAHEDDAERALAAAMALRKAVAEDQILGESFQLRMGVNTGEVVATSDRSSGDFLVTGDAVNVAARLQQHAQPSEIVASERTMNAARTAFTFDEPRLIEAKGKSQLLRVYPLKGAQEKRVVQRPPFVGRKQDVMQLQLLEARVLEEERPQLVSIVAPAGTGKTRLLEEFLRRIDPDEGFQTAIVRCLPYGQTLAYWPLRGLLNGMLDGEGIAKPNIMAIFEQASYKAEDASRLADLILATLGIESDTASAADRESIFAAWRLLIEAFALLAPRILIFEDLHWASDSMLDLVEHITHQHIHARLLLIVLSRPELLDRRTAWGGGRQNFTAIALQPLNAAQTQDLVARLSAEMPEQVRKEIVERSGGNPFFALELVRGLAERGLTGDAVSMDKLPDTVHAAVQARIDLLSRHERTALQVAAVASRGIRPAMLHAVLQEYSMQEIETALDGLLARDMLVPASSETYAFRHILIRDVAYGTISRAERIRMHATIAAWLEEAASGQLDTYAELIAFHYREAVMLARQSAIPKAMPRETERAVYYLERAAEMASRAGAFAEAKDYFRNAIALAPEADLLRLNEMMGDSLVWGNDVIEAYKKAIERWRIEGEQNPLIGARLLRKLLQAYRTIPTGSTRELREELWEEEQKLTELAGDEDEQWRLRIEGLYMMLDRALRDGSLPEEGAEEALTTCLQAATYFEQREDWQAYSRALEGCGNTCWTMGKHQQVFEVMERRLAIPDLPVHERGDSLGMITTTYFLLGDYDACIATGKEALAALRPGDPVEYFVGVLSMSFWSLYLSGRWHERSLFFNALNSAWERLQLRPGAGRILFEGYLITLLIAKAQDDRPGMDAASSIIERMFPDDPEVKPVIALFRDQDISEQTIAANFNVGMTGVVLMLFSERGLTAPDRYLKESIFQNDLSIWTRNIALALANNDNAALARAIDEAEEHELLVHAARMRVVLAQRTGERALLARARPLLERIEDRQFLRRLEEIEAILESGRTL